MIQPDSIYRVSIEKDLKLVKALTEYERKMNSASSEHIFVEFKLSFERLSGQKLASKVPGKCCRCSLLTEHFLKIR